MNEDKFLTTVYKVLGKSLNNTNEKGKNTNHCIGFVHNHDQFEAVNML